MRTMTLLPQSRPLCRDDLAALPDDGHRYELIDGALIVTPAPGTRHQTVVGGLHLLLHAACPPDLKVLLAPFDVALTEQTVVQPDVLVTRRSDLTERDLPRAPLLAVEVLSPSTRHIDLTLKKATYETAGCPSYWVVDPLVPALTAWDLHDGRYVEAAHVAGAEAYDATAPFAVRVVPNDLID